MEINHGGTKQLTELPTGERKRDGQVTVGEASSLMMEKRCRYASNRKVQRMCRDGIVECQKITTTRDGNPVTEWLVDRTSLLRHIEENEPKWDGRVPQITANGELASALSRTGVGDASHASGDKTAYAQDHVAPSNQPGAAFDARDHLENSVSRPDDAPSPRPTGTAAGDDSLAQHVDNSSDAMATPEGDGDATGETRTLADVLIDNAKLTAELGGARQLIEAITDEKGFLREELREARAGRKDVTTIAERMLQALETIAIGGKLKPPNAPPQSMPTPQATPTGRETKEPTRFAPQWRHGDNPPEQGNPYQV